MNGNINKVNENLYIVNFQYVKDGFIQELKFMDENADDLVKISTDGKMLLNAVFIQRMSPVIPVIVAVMNLDDKDLHSRKGRNRLLNQRWKNLPLKRMKGQNQPHGKPQKGF